MERREKRLSDLAIGESGIIKEILATGAVRHRLIDLGFLPGGCVTCVGKSPFRDPSAYLLRSAVIAVRGCDAEGIVVF